MEQVSWMASKDKPTTYQTKNSQSKYLTLFNQNKLLFKHQALFSTILLAMIGSNQSVWWLMELLDLDKSQEFGIRTLTKVRLPSLTSTH